MVSTPDSPTIARRVDINRSVVGALLVLLCAFGGAPAQLVDAAAMPASTVSLSAIDETPLTLPTGSSSTDRAAARRRRRWSTLPRALARRRSIARPAARTAPVSPAWSLGHAWRGPPVVC